MSDRRVYDLRYAASSNGRQKRAAACRRYRERYPERCRDASRRSLAKGGRDRQRAYLAANRAVLIAEKNKPCTDCGATYPVGMMHLDHVEQPTEFWRSLPAPQRGFSTLVRCAVWRLREEVARCEVVCLECHMERGRKRGQHSRKHSWDLKPGRGPKQLDLPLGDVTQNDLCAVHVGDQPDEQEQPEEKLQ